MRILEALLLRLHIMRPRAEADVDDDEIRKPGAEFRFVIFITDSFSRAKPSVPRLCAFALDIQMTG